MPQNVRAFVSTPLPSGFGGATGDFAQGQAVGKYLGEQQSLLSVSRQASAGGSAVDVGVDPGGSLHPYTKQMERAHSVLGERTDGPEAEGAGAMEGFQLRGNPLDLGGGNKRFSFDIYTWGNHSYKPKVKDTLEPLHADPAMNRSFHGSSGNYLLERSASVGPLHGASSATNLMGETGSSIIAGVNLDDPVQGLGAAAPPGVEASRSQPAGIGLSASMAHDAPTAAAMGASLRARSSGDLGQTQSSFGSHSEMMSMMAATGVSSSAAMMPMPLPSSVLGSRVAVGGGMVDPRRRRGGSRRPPGAQNSRHYSSTMASSSGSVAEWKGSTSSSAKDRVFSQLHPVR